MSAVCPCALFLATNRSLPIGDAPTCGVSFDRCLAYDPKRYRARQSDTGHLRIECYPQIERFGDDVPGQPTARVQVLHDAHDFTQEYENQGKEQAATMDNLVTNGLWNDLPNELVLCVLERTPLFMWPVVRTVNRHLYNLVVSEIGQRRTHKYEREPLQRRAYLEGRRHATTHYFGLLVERGHTGLARYVHAVSERKPCLFHAICVSAERGDVATFDWLCARTDDIVKRSNCVIIGAARAGRNDMVKQMVRDGFSLDSTVIANFACADDRAMIQWLRDNGCPWGTNVMCCAASVGNLELATWLLEQGCPISSASTEFAAQRGHVHVLAWLLTLQRPNLWTRDVVAGAAEHARTDVLQWLSDHAPPTCWDDDAGWCESAEHGHINVLKWMHARRAIDGPECMAVSERAAAHGRLNVLQWVERATPHLAPHHRWNHWACSAAAKSGHLDILVWLRARGCGWSVLTCEVAALAGHLHVLKWAIEQGCPHSPFSLVRCACERGQLSILQWLYDRNDQADDLGHVCVQAARLAHLPMLRWACQKGATLGTDVVAKAVFNGDLEMLDWIWETGRCPRLTWQVSTMALSGGRIDMLEWLQSRDCPWDIVTVGGIASGPTRAWLDAHVLCRGA